jgi:hypothetical protein
MSRACKTLLITQSKDGGREVDAANLPPIELSLTWLLSQIDEAETSQFKVDTEDEQTKTPRRNNAVKEAEDFAARLRQWYTRIRTEFLNGVLLRTLQSHNPAKPIPPTFTIGQLLDVNSQYSLFNPILPLMEDREPSVHDDSSIQVVRGNHTIGVKLSTTNNDTEQNELLPAKDVSRLLDEHVQTITGACEGIKNLWPSDSSDNLLSSSEAILSLTCSHVIELSDQYVETMEYIESMMESQLIAAIGKRLTSKDLDQFVVYHNARLLSPSPRPFSHAIRRPEHYPGKSHVIII